MTPNESVPSPQHPDFSSETDADEELSGEQLVLADLLNHVLDKGVVITAQVTISIADIDLIALDLRLLLTSVQSAIEREARGTPRQR